MISQIDCEISTNCGKDKVSRARATCLTRVSSVLKVLVIFDWFVLSMPMQVILDSLFTRPGSAPIGGGKKGEFRDRTNILIEKGTFVFYAVLLDPNE